MACIACHGSALGEFCSNDCFRDWNSRRRTCALCQVDRRTGRVGNPHTSRLCARCEADPANVDWVTGREELDEELEQHAQPQRHADLVDMPLRPVTERQQRILDLATRGELVRKQRTFRRGRRRIRNGTYVISRAMSFRAIARAVGVSDRYVRNVIRRQLEA
jgi:hypothetical protein